MLFKNEGRLQFFNDQYPDIVKRKKEVIEKFDNVMEAWAALQQHRAVGNWAAERN